MSTWDQEILSAEANADFLNELSELEAEEILEAVGDAVLLAADSASATEEEVLNGQAAATIAAIWCGAPFAAGEIVDTYPFIRSNPGELGEQLVEAAVGVLEKAASDADADADIDQFIEALS